MYPALKSAGLTMFLVCSTTIALCSPGTTERSPVLAQLTVKQARKADGVDAALGEANRLLQQGTHQFETAEYEAALSSLQQALKLYQQDKNQNGEAQTLIVLSNLYTELEKTNQGIDLGEKAVKLAREIKSRLLEGRALSVLGIAYFVAQQDQKAQKILEESLKIAREIQDQQTEGRVLVSLSGVYTIVLEQPEKAITVAQQAVTIAQQLKDRRLEGRAFWRIGLALDAQKKTAPALTVYLQGLEASRAAGDRRNIGMMLLNIGGNYNILKEYKKAIPYLQEGVEFAETLPIELLKLQIPHQLANAYMESNQYALAIPFYQKAIAAAEQSKNLEQQYSIWSELAANYFRTDDYANSRKAREQVLRVAQQLKNSEVLADAYRRLGNVDILLEDHKTALKYLLQAVELYQKVPDSAAQQSNVWSSVGTTYFRLNDLANARSAYEQALKFAQPLKDLKQQAQILQQLGIVANQAGRNQEALSYYQQAILLLREIKDHQGELSALRLQLGAFNELEEYDQAIATIQQRLELARSLPNAEVAITEVLELAHIPYVFLGQKYESEKNESKALETYQALLKLGQQSNRKHLQAYALSHIGSSYYKQGEFDLALPILKQGLALANESNTIQAKPYLLMHLGAVYLFKRDYAKSLEYFQQKRQVDQELFRLGASVNSGYKTLSEAEKHRQDEKFREISQFDTTSTVQGLALTYRALKDYPKAIEFTQLVLKIAQQRQEFDRVLDAASGLIQVYDDALQPAQGVEFAQAFLKDSERQNNPKLIAAAQVLVGVAYYTIKDFSQSILALEKSRIIAQKTGDDTLHAKVLNVLSEAYLTNNDFQNSIDRANQALSLAPKLKVPSIEIDALVNLSRAYLGIGNYDQAIEYAQKGLDITQRNKDKDGQARLWLVLGVIYNFNQDYAKAIDAFERSRTFAKESPEAAKEVAACVLNGYLNTQLGAPNRPNAGCQPNATLAQYIGGREQALTIEATTLLSSSASEFSLSSYQKSLSFAQQSLALAQKQKNTSTEADAYNLIGLNYAELSDEKQAIANVERAISVAQSAKKKDTSGLLTTLADIHREFGRTEKAVELYQQAIALQNKASNAYTGLARIYREKQPALAIVFYKQSVDQIETLRQKNRALPKDLQESFLQSIQGLGRTKVADTYRELANLLLTQGRILEAQQTLELLKVQELKDFDRTTRAKIDHGKIELDPTEQTIVNQYGSFIAFGQKLRECQKIPQCAEYDRLSELRNNAQTDYDRAVKTFEAALRARKQEDENNFLNPKNRFSGNVQRLLEKQDDTALIYSLVTDDKLWLVLASKGEAPRQFEVKVSQSDLNSAVIKFRQLMEQCERRSCGIRDTTELNTVSQQLYGWLFPKPLQQELQGRIKHLIFAPDRITRYIPMSALFDGKQYLIENYTVSTIISAEYTNTDRPNYDPQKTTVLAVGLSNAAPPNFPPLSNVPLELASIVQTNSTPAGVYPGLELLNQQFDLRSLQKNLFGHTILHIATHGAFVREQADASYILLGTGQKLPISTIKKLNDLGNVQLVVLSACQTALADRGADGIEISNVSFSFIERGVKAVIASLWQVNDSSTSLLMQRFYQNLATGKMTKVEALRQAQLSLLQGKLTTKDAPQRSPSLIPVGASKTEHSQVIDFSHPYYWAPFIIIGNGL